MRLSFIDLDFKLILAAASHGNFEDADFTSFVYLAPISLFSEHEMTISIGEHLERFDYAHAVCLMYTLVTSSKDTNDLSIAVDESNARFKIEMSDNKQASNEERLRVKI